MIDLFKKPALGSFPLAVKLLFLISVFFISFDGLSQEFEPSGLEKVDAQIDAIRKKIEWVKSNPSEDAGAQSSGWYLDMSSELDKLFDKKRNLIFSQSGKKWVSIEEFEEVLEKKKPILLNDNSYLIEQN